MASFELPNILKVRTCELSQRSTAVLALVGVFVQTLFLCVPGGPLCSQSHLGKSLSFFLVPIHIHPHVF